MSFVPFVCSPRKCFHSFAAISSSWMPLLFHDVAPILWPPCMLPCFSHVRPLSFNFLPGHLFLLISRSFPSHCTTHRKWVGAMASTSRDRRRCHLKSLPAELMLLRDLISLFEFRGLLSWHFIPFYDRRMCCRPFHPSAPPALLCRDKLVTRL